LNNNHLPIKSNQKSFWFILDNYVHLSLKVDSALLYNPLNGQILEYKGSGNKPIFKLLSRLQSPQNLFVVRLTSQNLENKKIAGFVNDVRINFMGNIIDTATLKKKPIQLMPMLKIHKDVEKIKKSTRHSVGSEMMKYPVEISLYINGACSQNCSFCQTAYKQFLSCTKGKNIRKELDIDTINDIFQQLKSAPLDRVNILGGNIFKYSQWQQLTTFINSRSKDFEICLYVHYLNLVDEEEKLSLFTKASISSKILVTFPLFKVKWKQMIQSISPNLMESEFLFLLEEDSHLQEADEIITHFQLQNYSFQPLYNGKNEDFFSQNVFLDKEDLQESKPGTSEILARQVINPFHFGRLTILNNGAIYANVNAPSLGNIKKNSLYLAVYKEMLHGKSWRRTRKKVKPCNQCTYNALCPPLSNYEYVLNKNNLCHINY
jgi:pseudo-rSAM protein